MTLFIYITNKVNNYMFLPKAAIFRLSQLQFCSKSVIYIYIYITLYIYITNKVNNYMFRPKAAIFRLSQLQFCSKSVIYI